MRPVRDYGTLFVLEKKSGTVLLLTAAQCLFAYREPLIIIKKEGKTWQSEATESMESIIWNKIG